jgi:hypothetical protein
MKRLAIAVPLLAAGLASAQHADLTITHDDPDGIVLPGQTVNFELRISWTSAFQILRVSGDIAAADNLGLASGLAGPTPGELFAPWSSSLGTPAGGSIDNINLEFIPLFFVAGLPPCVSYAPSANLGPFLSWQWTAPATPATIDIDFIPELGTTGVWALMSPVTPFANPMPTTYHGTSLTVIPAPAALAALAVGAVLAPRRRS